MDENKPPEEPIVTPEPDPVPAPEPAPEPVAVAPDPPTTSSASGIPTSVPFQGQADPTATQEERTQGLIAWVLCIFTWWLGPLIMMMINKDKPFAHHHAAQALTVGLMTTALSIVGAITFCLGIGVIILSVIGFYPLIVGIMGAIAANNGNRFEPPVTGNLSKSWFKA